ncbi:hypothetical protein D9M71_621030 [compost metagenome]
MCTVVMFTRRKVHRGELYEGGTASLLATGRGNASAVIVRAQPPTALLSVGVASSFPITSRRSASAWRSWGKVVATRLPTAALRPIGWGSPSWVAGPCSGWACYFIGWFLLWRLFSATQIASHLSPASHISCSMLFRFVCVVSRACVWKHGSYPEAAWAAI